MAVKIWQSAGSGNASVAGNWNGGVPANGDTAQFDASGAGNCNWDIVRTGIIWDIRAAYGGTISINANESHASVSQAGGVLHGTGSYTITLTGAFTQSGGQIDTLTIKAAGAIDFNGTVNASVSVIGNAGASQNFNPRGKTFVDWAAETAGTILKVIGNGSVNRLNPAGSTTILVDASAATGASANLTVTFTDNAANGIAGAAAGKVQLKGDATYTAKLTMASGSPTNWWDTNTAIDWDLAYAVLERMKYMRFLNGRTISLDHVTIQQNQNGNDTVLVQATATVSKFDYVTIVNNNASGSALQWQRGLTYVPDYLVVTGTASVHIYAWTCTMRVNHGTFSRAKVQVDATYRFTCNNFTQGA